MSNINELSREVIVCVMRAQREASKEIAEESMITQLEQQGHSSRAIAAVVAYSREVKDEIFEECAQIDAEFLLCQYSFEEYVAVTTIASMRRASEVAVRTTEILMSPPPPWERPRLVSKAN